MKVFRSKFSGFCPGVVQAEKRIFKARSSYAEKPIYVLGYLIHNQTYIDYLAEKAVLTVENPEEIPKGSRLVIRTHGIRRETEDRLKKDFPLLDLTCPKVKKIQLVIKEYSDKGYYVIITGKRNHPEVQGLLSYAERSTVVEKEEDVVDFIGKYSSEKPGRILVISQTTGERNLFDSTFKKIRDASGMREITVEAYDSICSITSLREQDALRIQSEADVTFVIGDKMSSNASKLYKILVERNPATYFVNSRKELEAMELPLSSWRSAQVVSSSSTPAFLEREIVDFLKSM